MISYNEILENMKTTYFEQSGEVLDMNGESGIRFKAIATELFNLYVAGEYLLKQSAWMTATGKYLDRIATECSVVRKKASKAVGEITFLIDGVREKDTVIPEGVVCSKKGYKYIQYKTLEQGIIRAGETAVSVRAEALFCGEEYNASYGEVSVMVNPPSGIAMVENRVSFIGGCDDENDEALRLRIKDALMYPANGVNAEFLKGRIMTYDEVIGCDIIRENAKLVCVLKTRDKTVSTDLEQRVRDVLSLFTLFNFEFEVRNADENSA